MPAPAVTGAILLCSAVSWPRSASMVGQICTHTWFMSSREPLAPRLARARRIASRQLAMARSTCGRPDDLAGLVAHDDELAHLREGDEALVVGVVLGDALVEQDVLGRLEPGHVEVVSRHRLRRRPTIGCTPRTRRSSTSVPSTGRKVK